MIYDCFTFFNELDLLEIRLNILHLVVDKFVLVEADRTFSNKKKPFYFEENKSRYEPFLEKIIHIKIDTYPFEYINSAWDMEYYQRNQINEGLKNCCKDDSIIISDLDEIPNPEEIIKYKNGVYGKGLFAFRQILFHYFLNYQKVVTKYWYRAAIISYQTYSDGGWTPQKIRNKTRERKMGVIKNGGWHFSFLGGYESIVYKMKSFAHQEFNNEKYINAKIIEKVKNGYDVTGLKGWRFVPVKIKATTFPQYIVDNQSKYSALIFQENNNRCNVWVYISVCMTLVFPLRNLIISLLLRLLKFVVGTENYEKIKQIKVKLWPA